MWSSRRTGKVSLGTALDLIGYLPLESHTVPLLEGLGFLEAYYRMLEKRAEHQLTHQLRVRKDHDHLQIRYDLKSMAPL